MSNITEKNLTGVNDSNKTFIADPIVKDTLSASSHINTVRYSEEELFDKNLSQGLKLMCGDNLLRTISSIASVTIRSTATPGLYKLILNSPEFKIKVRYIDESQLVNDRAYCSGTISKLDEDNYEITYFDSQDEIVIEHFNKKEAMNFIKENKLMFQL